MTGYLSDLRHAARTLTRARAFTAVCVVSLGLGMGVVMAILLLIRMVFATPPGVKTDRLVELVIRPTGQLLAQAGNDVIDTFSYPDYLDVRDAANGMVVTGWSRGDGLVRPAEQDPPIPVPTMYVSSNYFSNLGVALARGAGFTTVNDASRAEPEAVIGHRAWQIRFSGDPNIIGRSVTINQAAYTVVGVAPDGFRGHVGGLNNSSYSLWLPLSHHPRLASASARLARDAAWVRVFARRSEGTALAQADAVVRSAMATLADRYPSTNQEKAGGAEPYFPPGARLRRQVSLARLILLGLSGMVLLVVGLNISGMMMVRSAMRQRELAVRVAMGANRWRLVRYHFSEALVVAVLGGAFASAVLFGAPVLVAWALHIVSPAIDLFKPDLGLVLQCVALCFVTSLVLGALPAVRFSRPSIVTALKNDSAGSGQRVGRLQRFTAAAQAGLAVPFLVICGVYLDQARTTAFADVGFTPKGPVCRAIEPRVLRENGRGAAALRAHGAGEPRAGAWRDVGDGRRRTAARLQQSWRAHHARGRIGVRRRALDARWARLSGHARHAAGCRPFDRCQRPRRSASRRRALRAAGAPALPRRRAARRACLVCRRRGQAADLHRHRHQRGPGVDADGQSTAAAVRVTRPASGAQRRCDRARRAVGSVHARLVRQRDCRRPAAAAGRPQAGRPDSGS